MRLSIYALHRRAIQTANPLCLHFVDWIHRSLPQSIVLKEFHAGLLFVKADACSTASVSLVHRTCTLELADLIVLQAQKVSHLFQSMAA